MCATATAKVTSREDTQTCRLILTLQEGKQSNYSIPFKDAPAATLTFAYYFKKPFYTTSVIPPSHINTKYSVDP